MKKIIAFTVLILIFTGVAIAQVRQGATMFVAVREAPLKSGTGLFASNTGSLNYGDSVTILQVSGNFAQVRSNANASVTGWIASASLTARQITSSSSGTASAREIALAGKGFNQEVENSYKSSNRNLNYTAVDRMEAITVSETDLRRFLEEGRLRMGE